jgi:hypothetical protein
MQLLHLLWLQQLLHLPRLLHLLRLLRRVCRGLACRRCSMSAAEAIIPL